MRMEEKMAKNSNSENIMIRDYEIEVFNNLERDDEFLNYLNRNKDKKLLLDYNFPESIRKKTYGGKTEAVLDYLEEISFIIPEKEEDLFLKNVNQVASIAFYYLKDGISYLDIVQEGNLGLLKAIDKFKNSGFSNFNDYKNYWVIREMILYIKKIITDIQYEFESFFKDKKENFNRGHHECSDDDLYEENDNMDSLEIVDENNIGLKKIDREEINREKIDIEEINREKINIEEIELKEKKLKEKLNFFTSENRLTNREIEILKYYFGFGKEKRYSMYEIEKEMGLSSGQGEYLFKQAMIILSDLDGRVVI
jgi:RNA polymerase sigma factor (sigma-70 family)